MAEILNINGCVGTFLTDFTRLKIVKKGKENLENSKAQADKSNDDDIMAKYDADDDEDVVF